MSKAYKEGHYAGYHGEPEDSNPHTEFTAEFWDWIEGYVDGELEAQEDGFK